MITDPDIEAYLERIQPVTDEAMLDMQDLAQQRDFPIIGPCVGRLCRVLARSVGATRVFEMGSGFGYSTAWFAQAVGPGGTVVHTEFDEGNTRLAKDFLGRMGLADRVRFEVGDALETAQRMGGRWDVVFVDIDKQDYPKALDWARAHLRPGGLLIVDNTLWQGKVLDPDLSEPMTEGVVRFTEALQRCDDLDWTLVPLRDGVAMALKR